MKIEYFYDKNGKATMELDAEALRTLEAALIDLLKGGELSTDDLEEICKSITEIVHALDRLSEQEPEERIVRCGECVFSEEEGGGIACTRTKDGIIRCELDYCSMGHLHEEDAE